MLFIKSEVRTIKYLRCQPLIPKHYKISAPGKVTDFIVTTVSSTELQVTWKEPLDKGCPEDVLEYKVEYSASAVTSDQCGNVPHVNNTIEWKEAPTLKIQNLLAFTTYYVLVKVQTRSKSGISNCSIKTLNKKTNPTGK